MCQPQEKNQLLLISEIYGCCLPGKFELKSSQKPSTVHFHSSWLLRVYAKIWFILRKQKMIDDYFSGQHCLGKPKDFKRVQITYA